MRAFSPISADAMIASFLRGELESARFRERMLELLRQDGRGRGVITSPRLDSEAENAYRRSLLGRLRGYGMDQSLFRGFPDRVAWERTLLARDELSRVRYINWDYWLELSGGTRVPLVAAERIRRGIQACGEDNGGFWSAVEAQRRGERFRELIIVTHDEETLVVLEGHVRLTAYALEPSLAPDEMEVILGRSPRMAGWPLY